MDKEYLSIKEFAEAAGVSQQAIYKQLNNKLKPYLIVVEKRKMLEKSALSLFSKAENSKEVEQQLINMLQTELNRKNEQIAELQKLLDQAQKLHAMDKQRILELEDKAAEEQQREPARKRWWQKFSIKDL